MNRKSFFKLVTAFITVLVVSCNEPETVVTDYVHPDGSVTRKIEMKTREGDANKRFKISEIQVPFDGSWIVRDSCKIDEKGDTTWIRRGEKFFKSVDEINLEYKSDSGSNKKVTRSTGFKKRFKWFNTEYRFSERIEKRLSYGYPVADFLNSDELLCFYSPESLKNSNETGPDSLKFRALNDSVKEKTDAWTARNIVSGWIGIFSKLTSGKTDSDMSVKSLKSHEAEFAKIIEKDDKKLDSLWKNGILLKEFLGETNALKYRVEADSALSIVINNLLADFSDYSVRIAMPGRLIGTNGFIDSSKVLLWPVKSDYFLTEPYEMWAESKIPNRWAWIVSGLFLAFVVTGVILRIIKKD
jgi:hypothetical protein